jgi:centromere protein C
MPTSTPRARSTSLGPTRRGPQKAHIPFRADDLEHGKKTGLRVGYVDHKSDEFEPFSEVMGQADGRTPPGPGRNKGKGRKSKGREEEENEGDEHGEMSMELDHSALFSQSTLDV